ncbi:hypothetical protein OF83DRAFT_1180757 [Amylostereum chailletii]|nr:hypothetical protein OF83DRAFT_1180757 [Amylostereum chailletii]
MDNKMEEVTENPSDQWSNEPTTWTQEKWDVIPVKPRKHCWKCGERGHLRRDCPRRKNDPPHFPQSRSCYPLRSRTALPRPRPSHPDISYGPGTLMSHPHLRRTDATARAHRQLLGFLTRHENLTHEAAQHATEQWLYWEDAVLRTQQEPPSRFNHSWRVADLFWKEEDWDLQEAEESKDHWPEPW